MLKADALIRESVLVEPDAIRAALNAFDESWASASCSFIGQSQVRIENARIILAKAVLNAAAAGHTEVGTLKQEGIRALKVGYPRVSF
jgi:hypothetical protein